MSRRSTGPSEGDVIDRHGVSREEVLAELAQVRRGDAPWNRVLNSICTVPHPIGIAAFVVGIDTNLGDPRIFKGTDRRVRRRHRHQSW